MDIEQVARVVKLVESSQLYKVTIENNGQSVTVVNNVNQHEIASPVKTKAVQDSTYKNSADQNAANLDSALSQVRATHVGRVYLSEDGATDHLVSKGDHIEKGQTICFIEELTRLLPVVSDKAGVVSDILVENGQIVEYGQPVFNLKI
ncbi:biotin/lipoyl-containing protein [Psychrobacter sp. S1-30-MNA-CIBAN-0213]|uniref:acetyl-CoA carboxylase biotin carboxyl carrier protein n=1 Tax=unclassified Psychrobacter TaxID=196806 RepID=UPI00332A0084